jgi:hypothetical protein
VLSLSLWLYSPLNLGRFFSFLILYTVGRTPWTGDQPVARPLPTQRTTQTQNKSTQTTMSRMGFEPTIPVFERANTIHALDRAATVIGCDHKLPKRIVNLLAVGLPGPQCMQYGPHSSSKFAWVIILNMVLRWWDLYGSSFWLNFLTWPIMKGFQFSTKTEKKI